MAQDSKTTASKEQREIEDLRGVCNTLEDELYGMRDELARTHQELALAKDKADQFYAERLAVEEASQEARHHAAQTEVLLRRCENLEQELALSRVEIERLEAQHIKAQADLGKLRNDHEQLIANKYTSFPTALEADAEPLCRVIEAEAKKGNADARNLQAWMGVIKARIDAHEPLEHPQAEHPNATVVLREAGRHLIALSADAPHVAEQVAELLNPGLERLFLELMVPVHGQMVNRDFMSPTSPGSRVNSVVCWGVIAQCPNSHPFPLHRAEVTAF